MRIITYGEIAKPDDIQEIHEYAEAYTSFNEASVEFSNITKLISLYSEAATFSIGAIIMSFLKLLIKLFGGVYVKAFAAIAALIGIAYKLTKGSSASVSVGGGGGGGGGSSSSSTVKTEIIESDGKKTVTEERTVKSDSVTVNSVPMLNKMPLMITYKKQEVKEEKAAPEVIDTINVDTGTPEPQKVEEAPKVAKEDVKSWFAVLPTGVISIVSKNIDDTNLQKISSAIDTILSKIDKDITLFKSQTYSIVNISEYDELLTAFESLTETDNIVGLFDEIITKIEAGETEVTDDLRTKEKNAKDLIVKACSILKIDQKRANKISDLKKWSDEYRSSVMLQATKTNAKSMHAFISKNHDDIPIVGFMDYKGNSDGSTLLSYYLNGKSLNDAKASVEESKKRADAMKTALSGVISKVDNKEIGRNEGALAAFTASFAQDTLSKLNTFMLSTQYGLEQVLKLFNAAVGYISISNVIVEKLAEELSK